MTESRDERGAEMWKVLDLVRADYQSALNDQTSVSIAGNFPDRITAREKLALIRDRLDRIDALRKQG